tara:strand:+ start:74319 stop:74570 length:252 start_codon:yes stop_codon:yes gene_type:complete
MSETLLNNIVKARLIIKSLQEDLEKMKFADENNEDSSGINMKSVVDVTKVRKNKEEVEEAMSNPIGTLVKDQMEKAAKTMLGK